MNIRDEARQAAQGYAQRHVGGMQPVETIGDRVRAAFEAGAVWRDEQADPEPSDADFNRAAQTFYEASGLNLPHTSKPEVVAGVRAAWAALIDARKGD